MGFQLEMFILAKNHQYVFLCKESVPFFLFFHSTFSDSEKKKKTSFGLQPFQKHYFRFLEIQTQVPCIKLFNWLLYNWLKHRLFSLRNIYIYTYLIRLNTSPFLTPVLFEITTKSSFHQTAGSALTFISSIMIYYFFR